MGPLHQRVPAAHRYLPHVLRHLIPGACPRALGPGGCCAFRENASAATSALTVTARPRRGLPLRSTLAPAWGGKTLPPGARPEGRCAFRENPPAAPVDATATRPDRRDAAPGGAWQGRCAFRENTPAAPPMPPRPIRAAGTQPLVDSCRVVAHFAKTAPAAPADATATRPDRRDAAPGRPSQGRCAFCENPPAAPADATATHCDRRDTAPGGPWQGRCAFRENPPAASRSRRAGSGWLRARLAELPQPHQRVSSLQRRGTSFQWRQRTRFGCRLTPAATADATATHPDRRYAAPG
jgi:hypothetical protein